MLATAAVWERGVVGNSGFLSLESSGKKGALITCHGLLTGDVQFLFKHAYGSNVKNSLTCRFVLTLLLLLTLFSSVISVVLVNG